jgi:hypothetical protein
MEPGPRARWAVPNTDWALSRFLFETTSANPSILLNMKPTFLLLRPNSRFCRSA